MIGSEAKPVLKRKKILLLGAGHAHIQVLHQLASMDRSCFDLTLISDQMHSSYSGMIPSYLAGRYDQKQLQFDLQKICDRFNYTFSQGEVITVDALNNKVQVSNGAEYQYDICSINIGIKPQGIPIDLASNSEPNVIYLKPISELITQWNRIIQDNFQPASLTIIGGGAAAFEIAVACRLRFNSLKVHVRLITGHSKLLSIESPRAQKLARQSLLRLNIQVIEGVRVEKIENKNIVLSNGDILERQFCLIATSAEAPQLFRKSQLPASESGFVRVDQNLNVIGYKNLFAAGDCCEVLSHHLPKAGVYAVREGPILTKNIAALLEGSSQLTAFMPQPSFLKILITGNNQALLMYKNFSVYGWLPWRLKDYIDRNFMARFQ